MAIDASSFVIGFPEFEKAPRALIEAKIAEATTRLDETVWGAKYDIGLSYLTAHLLSTSPWGRQARLIPENAKPIRGEALTTYEREYDRLVRTVSSGWRVSGTNVTS